jgi:hypothetical protein
MKLRIILITAMICALSMLVGCALPVVPTTTPASGETTQAPTQATTTPATVPTTVPTTVEPTIPETDPTVPPTTVPPTTAAPTVPPHSELYIPGVSVEDVIRYFNEVCLDAEFVNGGDPSLLQRWEDPIRFACVGTPTEKDREVLNGFVEWLNTIEGFPGMWETEDYAGANLQIHFYGPQDYIDLMGDNFYGTDGGVTFWYNGANEIYRGTIGYRTDVDQEVRNSVILEEIYNGLGPVADTDLRRDSIIYSGYSIPQQLTEIDELILKLLYHPQMWCGMNAAACEEVIRQLYF